MLREWAGGLGKSSLWPRHGQAETFMDGYPVSLVTQPFLSWESRLAPVLMDKSVSGNLGWLLS